MGTTLRGLFVLAFALGAESVAQAPTATVDVQVAWSDGAPASGVTVRLRPQWPEPVTPLDVRTARSDASGRATFVDCVTGPYRCESDRGGVQSILVERDGQAFALRVAPGRTIRGTVVDATAQPIAGAAVWLSAGSDPLDGGAFVATTDGSGQFTIRDVGAGRLLTAVGAGHRAAPMVAIGPGTTDLRVTLTDPGGSLRGRVVDSEGQPLPGARVAVTPVAVEPAQARAPYLEFRTDAAGAFEALGLPLGRDLRVWIAHPRAGPWSETCCIDGTGPAVLEARLPASGRIEGELRDGQGALVDGTIELVHMAAAVRARTLRVLGSDRRFRDPPPLLTATVFERAAPGVVEHLPLPFDAPAWSVVRVATVGGRFTIDAAPAGPIVLRARSGERRASRSLVLEAGSTAHWSPRVDAGGTIAGRIVDANGAAVLDHWIVAVPKLAGGEMIAAARSQDGSFLITGCDDGPYDLLAGPVTSLEPDHLLRHGATVRVAGLVANGGRTRLVVPLERPRNAYLRMDLRDPTGVRVPRAVVELEPIDADRPPERHTLQQSPPQAIGPAGRRRFCDDFGGALGPLHPGRYRLTVLIDGRRITFGAHTARAERTTHLGCFELPPARR